MLRLAKCEMTSMEDEKADERTTLFFASQRPESWKNKWQSIKLGSARNVGRFLTVGLLLGGRDLLRRLCVSGEKKFEFRLVAGKGTRLRKSQGSDSPA